MIDKYLKYLSKLSLLLLLLIPDVRANAFSHHGLFWSSVPHTNASLSSPGTWQDIDGSFIHITLDNKKSALISYEMQLEGLRELTGTVLPKENNFDTVQVRCMIDGVAYRSSSSFAFSYLVNEKNIATLAASFVVPFVAGNHSVSMQWKKLGNSVEEWIFSSSSGAGLAISVQADHSQIWSKNELNDKFISSNGHWQTLTSNIEFNTSVKQQVTIGYTVSAQPQLGALIKDRNVELLTIRISVDGIAYTEGSESHGCNSWNPSIGVLKGSLTITVAAGQHVASLQWKKAGATFRSWGSSPSYLDGFANSRNLYVIAGSDPVETLVNYKREILKPLSKISSWTNIGDNTLSFYLARESAVLFTYSLPMSQYENPAYDANVWNPESQLAVRLLIDNIPYSYIGSQVSANARYIDSTFGSIGLLMIAGSHTVSLQWKYKGSKWVTLNDINGGFAHGDKLLAYVSSANIDIVISSPANLSSIEDIPINFSCELVGVDLRLLDGIRVVVNLTVLHGYVSVLDPSILSTIEYIYTANYSSVLINDTMLNANSLLANLRYFTSAHWNGQDTIYVNVYTNDVTIDPTVAQTINVTIAPVDNPFTVEMMDVDTVNGIGSTMLSPIVLDDIDSLSSVFRVQIFSSCGRLTLLHNSSTKCLYSYGDGYMDSAIDFHGLYNYVKDVLTNISFQSLPNCEKQVHGTFLSIKVINTDNLSQNITKIKFLDILPVYYPPELVTSTYPRWSLDGIEVNDGSNESAVYTQYPAYYTSNMQIHYREILKPDNKNATAGMSELSVYRTSYTDFAFSVQYEVFSISLVSSKYAQLDKMTTILVSGAFLNQTDANRSFECVVEKTSFAATVVDNSTLSCNVSYSLQASDRPDWMKPYFTAWMQLYEPSSGLRTNFVPLYFAPASKIADVSPLQHFPSGQAIISFSVNLPGVVDTCFFALENSSTPLTAAVAHMNSVSYCRAPVFVNQSGNVQFLVGTSDQNFKSNVITLTVVPPLLIQSSTAHMVDESSIFVSMVGDFSAQLADLPSVSCHMQNIVKDAAILSGDSITCVAAVYELVSSPEMICSLATINISVSVNDQISNSIALNISSLMKTLSSCRTNNEVALTNSSVAADQNSSILFHTIIKVENIEPTIVNVLGGTDIVVTGGPFSPTSTFACNFNSLNESDDSVLLPATYISDSEVFCTTVPHSEADVTVSILVDDYVYSSFNKSLVLKYVSWPEVHSVYPLVNLISGGTEISISGIGFTSMLEGNSNYRLYCSFGSSISVVAQNVTDTSLSCVTPSWPQDEIVDITVLVSIFSNDSLASVTNILAVGSVGLTFIHPVALVGIYPNRVSGIGGTVVTLSGLFFPLSRAACMFDGYATTPATFIDKSTVQCVTPSVSENTTVNVRYVSDGVLLDTKGVNLSYSPAAHLLEISPISGTLSGGTNISAIGYGFDLESELFCAFGSTLVRAFFITESKITCVTPESPFGGQVPFSLVIDDQTIACTDDCKFFYSVPLNIISISPSVGVEIGGTLVNVEGSGFSSINVNGVSTKHIFCYFGKEKVPGMIVSDTSLTCMSPASLWAQSVDFYLMDTDGSKSQTLPYRFIDSPAVTGIIPDRGDAAGGNTVRIFGLSFYYTENVQCAFRTSQSSQFFYSTTARVINDNALDCAVPINIFGNGTITSPVAAQVEVFLEGSIIESTKISYTLFPTIIVDKVWPAYGSIFGGTNLTISGDNFPANERLYCMFGPGSLVQAYYISEVMISCVSETHAEGVVALSIGTVYASTVAGAFTFLSPPKIFSVAPAYGLISSVGNVTIYGTNFRNYSDVSGMQYFCKFGSVLSTVPAIITTDTSITCQLPLIDMKGQISITVGSDDMGWYCDGSVVLHILEQVFIRSIEPDFGPISGGGKLTVSILGSDVPSSRLKCRVGQKISSAIVENDGNITCIAPAQATAGDFQFSLLMDGLEINENRNNHFKSISIANVSGVSPSRGPSVGGTKVTVHGSNYSSVVDISCKFGDLALSEAIFISSTKVQCIAPTHSQGDVNFSLVIEGSEILSVPPIVFTYDALLVVSSITPAGGPVAGGTLVTVDIDGVGALKDAVIECKFGNLTIQSIEQSVGQVTCKSPPSESAQLVDFAVVVNGDLSLGDVKYRYMEVPQLLSVSPEVGYQTGGDLITIYGLNFPLDETDGSCKFGATGQSLPLRILSPTVSSCVSPPQNESIKLPIVLSFSGYEVVNPNVSFTFSSVPTITGISPSWSLTGMASNISISGSNFYVADLIACIFKRSDSILGQSGGIFVSEDLIICSTLPYLDGPVSLLLEFNGFSVHSSLDTTIELFSLPNVIGVQPSSGLIGQTTEIIVTGRGFVSNPQVQLHCHVGNFVSDAVVLSNSSVACAASGDDVSTAEVYISINDIARSSGSAYFRFIDGMLLTLLEPSKGFSTGQSVVSLHGYGFEALDNMECVFGNWSSKAVVVTDKIVDCITPPVQISGSSLIVAVALRGQDGIVLANGLTYEYIPPSFITNISPKYGPSVGDTAVSVSGVGFLFGNEIGCSFGESLVTATYVSSSELLCVAPSHAVGVANFSVIIDGIVAVPSTNGFDSFSFLAPVYNTVDKSITKWNSSAVILPSSRFIVLGNSSDSTIQFTGENLNINTPLLCAFGSNQTITTAVFLSSSAFYCPVPSTLTPRTVAIFIIDHSDNSTLFSHEVELVYTPKIVDISMPLDWGVVLKTTITGSLSDIDWSCTYNEVKYITYNLLNGSFICNYPPQLVSSGVYKLSSSSLLCTEDFNASNVKVLNETDLITTTLSSSAVNHDICGQFFDLLTFRIPSNLDCQSFHQLKPTKPSSIVRKYNSKSKPYNNNVSVSANSNFQQNQNNRSYVVGTMMDANAYCHVNGKSACFDENFALALVNQSAHADPTVVSNNTTAYLVIESIEPTVINASNGSWITIRGRTYSNSTTCTIYSDDVSLPLASVYLSTEQLRCFVPAYSVSNAAQLVVSLSDGSLNNQSYDLSGLRLLYDAFDQQYDRYPVLNTSIIKTAPVESGTLCKVKDGCISTNAPSVSTNELHCPLSNVTYFQSTNSNISYTKVLNSSSSYSSSSYLACEYYDFLLGAARTNHSDENSNYIAKSIEQDNSYYPKVFWMYPRELDMMQVVTDVIIGLDTQSVDPSTIWCLQLTGGGDFSATIRCFSDGKTIHCMVPSANISSLSVTGKLLWNCHMNSSIYGAVFSVKYGNNLDNFNLHNDRKSGAQDVTMSSSYTQKLVVLKILPFLGPIDGKATITLYGSRLDSVRYCSFRLLADGMMYQAPVIQTTVDGSKISFIAPTVSVPSLASISLLLKDGSSVHTNLMFRFIPTPTVLFSSFLDINDTLSVFGSNFPSFSAPICKVTLLNAEEVLVPGFRISDSEIQCPKIDNTTINIFSVSSVAVSVNGQDFLESTFTTQSKSPSDLSSSLPLQITSSSTSSSNPLAKIVSPSYNSYAEPIVTICDAYFEVPIFISRLQPFVPYLCSIDKEVGTAKYVNSNQLLCLFSSRAPGVYSVVVSDPSTQSIFAPVRLDIRCASKPKVLSLRLVGFSMYQSLSSTVVVTGLNFDKSLPLLVNIGVSEGLATFNNVKEVAATLDSLKPGAQTIVISTNGRVIFNLLLTISADSIKFGGTIFPSDERNSVVPNSDSGSFEKPSGRKALSNYTRKIASLNPRSGTSLGNTAVTIVASGIHLSDRITCVFGNAIVMADIVEYGRVVCHAPSFKPGNVSVSLKSLTTGNEWCCQSFVYHPLVQIRNITPNVLDSKGGTVIAIRVNNFIYLNVSLFCHFGTEKIAVYQVSPNTINCVVPKLSTSSLEVDLSIGSQYEVWSNTVKVLVSPLPTFFSIIPTHGTIYGGTVVKVQYPGLHMLSRPKCVFGNGAKSPQAAVATNNTLECVTPTFPVLGEVDVYILDGADSGILLLAGTYRFELPAAAYRVLPSSVMEGKSTILRIFGSNFVDSSSLSCLFGSVAVPSRWLSTSLLTCTIPKQSTLTDRTAVAVTVTNNGFDMSSPVKLTIISVNKVLSISILRGYVSGGNEILFSFVTDYSAKLVCLFGQSVRVSAYLVDSKDYVCIAPAFSAGNTSFRIIDNSNTPLYVSSYTYFDQPLLLTTERPVVLSGVDEVFSIYGAYFNQYTGARFVDIAGRSTPGSCSAVNESSLACSVNATGPEEFLFMDLTVNGVDYLPRFFTIQVFKPSTVVEVDALYLSMEGGQHVSFSVDRFLSSFSTYCMFKSKEGESQSIVSVVSDSNGFCIAPPLPLQNSVLFSIIQKDINIFGPVSALVLEKMSVLEYHPKYMRAGVPCTIYLNFARATSIFPLKTCFLQGQSSPLEMIHSTLGFCVLQPLSTGTFNFSIGFVGNFQSSTALGPLEIVQGDTAEESTFSISDDIVVVNSVQNITITSSVCGFLPDSYCLVNGGVSIIPYRASSCNLTCAVLAPHNTNTLKLSVCASKPCVYSTYSTTIRVIQMVSVVLLSPPSGPTTGHQPVTVYGSGFENDASLQCLFGSIAVPAVVHDSFTAYCTLPPYHNPGPVNVSMVRFGKIVSTSMATFEYFPSLLSGMVVSPMIISSMGGTNVSITTPFFYGNGPLMCRFQYKYVPAVMWNETRFYCESPPLDLQQVSFALSSNGADVSTVTTVSVESPSTVLFVDPVVVDSQRPYNISIFLTDFIQTDSLKCRLDAEILPIFMDLSTKILMCMKSDGSSSGYHNLTLSIGDTIIFTTQIFVRGSYQVMKVSPLVGFTGSTTTITISLNQLNIGSEYSKCCFQLGSSSLLFSPAMTLSNKDWQCLTPLFEHPTGLDSVSLSIGLSKAGGFCEYSGMNFTSSYFPQVSDVSPSSGSAVGGTIITVLFAKPIGFNILYCRLGTQVSIGQVVNGTQLLCITTRTPIGSYLLEISPNKLSYVSSGFMFEFLPLTATHHAFPLPSSSPSSQPGSPSSSAITLTTLDPKSFPSGGQFTVAVHGTGFQRGVVCLMGNSSYILSSLWISATEVNCVLPLHPPGFETIAVQNFDGTRSVNSLNITFIFDPSIYSTAPRPSYGSTSSHTIIQVFGNHLDTLNGTLYCYIDQQWSFALNITASSLFCETPFTTVSGKVKVQLSVNKRNFISGYTYFEYIRDPVIYTISPLDAAPNTPVLVTGIGFSRSPELTCLFGGQSVPATVISDSVLSCTSPTIQQSNNGRQLQQAVTNVSVPVSFSLMTNGQNFITSGIIFNYLPTISVSHLSPITGPSLRGGTLVSIFGSGFTNINSVDLYCIFGLSKVAAVAVSDTIIQCRSPPHRLGLVNVSVIAGNRLISSQSNNLQYLFSADVSVDKISPSFGYTSGIFPVFIFGSNFLNTSSLGCKFADMLSRGIYLSNNTMICLAPSPLGRPELNSYLHITVEVTVNGYDYSDSGVQFQYTEPCDLGFFCPGMTRQLCPNGTYCPANSVNFTLCSPGTFQPKEGQSGCLICPIGYICPDSGMSRPVNCPAGFVCDVMGLRSSIKLCPEGSYCLNGTKAADLSLFSGSTSWVQNYVTGVYSFNLSSYGSAWEYKSWPAPAVGQSRSLHPPAQQCDGLVCSGGSQSVLAEAPFPCPIGHYCRSGVTTQIPMVKNFSTPQRCFDGFFCPRGSKSPEGSGPCPNKYFCPTQLDALECPEGHYCPGVGNRAPLECYPGTYNPSPRQANCTVCPSGFICPGWGTLLPEPCPAGFVCTSLGLSYPVVMCPQGYYCVDGTMTSDPSSTILQKPVICKEGEFCLGGVFEDINVEWIPSQSYGGAFAQQCSEGTYCQAGAYLSSGTGLCYFGHYCPPKTAIPVATPKGNFASGEGSVAPTLCYPGTYAPLEAQVNCQVCPSGHTCLSYGTYIPSICLNGTYRSQIDSVTCNSCPTGTYSAEIGAVDITQCYPCPVRRVCPNLNTFNLTDSYVCPSGYVCGYGTDRSIQYAHSTPAGFYTSNNSAPYEIFNSVCEKGFYCPRGTPKESKQFGKCPVGSFCPLGVPGVVMAETLCPPHTTSISGRSNVTNCVIAQVDVCDKLDIDITKPMTDISYLNTHTYTDLNDLTTQYDFDSSLTSVNPTGEIQAVHRINPLNYTASSPVWVNETIEAFRACPLYGSGTGGDIITVIGRNFIDNKLNYCKFRACYGANIGEHPRRCRNQVNDKLGNPLGKAGNVSRSTYITRANYISPTRMECTVPEFIFSEKFNPDPTVTFYQCLYINSNGSIAASGSGNLSYVRQCSNTALYDCPNVPGKGLEFFPSLTFRCTTEQVLNFTCSHMPELNYMFNPCMSHEVLVEVTNDGEHYSGGVELTGTKIISTVRYGDGRKIFENFKNFTTIATFAVYTYVQPKYFYTNSDIMKMERQYCRLPRYSEEAARAREESWFRLNLNEAAHVHVNFSFVPNDLVYDQHYRLAIYIIPSRCKIESCDESRKRLAPSEVIPCAYPREFSNWFTDSFQSVSPTNPKNVKNNITVYALDDILFKVEVQILHGLHSMYRPLFENSTVVRIASPSRALSFTGMPLTSIETRTLSPYVSYEERRVPMQYFFCAVVYQRDTEKVSQMYNTPPTYSKYERGRALLMYNVSDENSQVQAVIDDQSITNIGPAFWLMPALTSDNSKEILDAYFETFQDTTYDPVNGYAFNFDTLLIPYLPYFSNCHTFDSYIPIWLLTEGKECELPDTFNKTWYRYKHKALPDQDHIKFTGPFDFFGEPIADWCYRSLSCNYEEDLTTTDSTPRWYEITGGEDTALFNLLRYPVNYTFYTGRPDSTRISQQDAGGGNAVTLYQADSGDNFIPVYVDHSIGDEINNCATQCFAREYTLYIKYYQVDNFTKKIVKASIVGDKYDFIQKNTKYKLQINYFALGFYDLILSFAYTPLIFMVIFVFLGIVTVIMAVSGWAISRMTTMLQNPPGVKLFPMIVLIVPPAVTGVYMAVVPIWILTSMGNLLLLNYFITNPNTPLIVAQGGGNLDLPNWNMLYNNIGNAIGNAEFISARAGRMGTVFFVVGFISWVVSANLHFPKKETKRERETAKMRTYMAEKEEIWQVVLWKKANFIFFTFVTTVICALGVELSYWGNYGTYIYVCILMFIVVGESLNVLIDYFLQDTICCAPVEAGYTFMTQLVTFGAPDFLTFLLSNLFGIAIELFQRVFQWWYVELFGDMVAFIYVRVVRMVKKVIPRYITGEPPKKKSDEIVQQQKEFKKRAVDDVQETGDTRESVEPILDYFSGVCGDTCGLFYFPYFVYLLMQYRVQIQLPILYLIRQSDMLIYMIFQLMMCMIKPLADAFVHFWNEQFHGWKIYEYLVYSRYRFLQRETRWKGMENTLDECIDENLRRVDQMCFSSQFYFAMTFHMSGMIYILLAFQCWLRTSSPQYNPFSDTAFIPIAIFLIVCFVILEFVFVKLAVWLKLWKIKHENTAWHMLKKDEDEWDLPGWEDVKGASTEAFLMNQRISSETFRYKFLNYNRTWLINQLPQLLTPRTMRRSRPYLINQFARIINARRDDISDDSDKDKDKKFGPVSLSASSRNIIRWWLGKARRRIRLSNIVDPLIKRARGAQCEICLSRKQLQVEYEVDIDKMADMYDRAYPGDEEVDQVQWKSFWMNNQRYHTICLACLTKRKEAAAKAAIQSGVLGFDASIFDDGQEDYPDWGPVYLTAASKAMLLNWYRKAQLLRAGKRGRRREKALKAISDDEEDQPFSWLQEMPNITPATNAIAVKWMRSARARLQKKKGKGVSIRESDAVEEEKLAAAETFKSGRKSKMLKK